MSHEGCAGCGAGVPQILDPNKLVQMLQGRQQEKWTDMLKKIIKRIESLPENPKDRLDAITSMKICLGTIAISIKGWNQWYKELIPFNEVDEKDIKEIYNKIREITLDLLNVDLMMTAKAEKIAEEREKKARKTAEKSEKREKRKTSDKNHYVA